MWRRIYTAFLTFMILGAGPQAFGQPATDEQTVRALAVQFETGWNTHDMNVLGSIVTEDIDFVNVAGMHWKGREEVVRKHAANHQTIFKDSIWTADAVNVQFIRPDMALVHVDSAIRGDTIIIGMAHLASPARAFSHGSL
jgi:uncharacterized protein (TIGR02246 family)